MERILFKVTCDDDFIILRESLLEEEVKKGGNYDIIKLFNPVPPCLPININIWIVSSFFFPWICTDVEHHSQVDSNLKFSSIASHRLDLFLTIMRRRTSSILFRRCDQKLFTALVTFQSLDHGHVMREFWLAPKQRFVFLFLLNLEKKIYTEIQ